MKYTRGAYAVSCDWCYQGKGKPCRGIGNVKGNSSFWNKILKTPHERRIRRAKEERRFA